MMHFEFFICGPAILSCSGMSTSKSNIEHVITYNNYVLIRHIVINCNFAPFQMLILFHIIFYQVFNSMTIIAEFERSEAPASQFTI